MRIVGLYLLILFALGCKSRLVNIGNEEPQGKVDVLELLPETNNPRNSEGDFITLKNGKILFIYSHFSGTSGSVTQEPGVVELKDGAIMMFIRASGGIQQLSYSKDKGETWSHIKPSEIKSPVAPASITRIPSSGDLLLAWNNNGIDQKRTPLSIAISRDEGITWENIKNIENDPNGSFCYTAIHFTGKYVLLGYWNRAHKNKSSSDVVRVNIHWIYDYFK